jgi:hypothetical protein
VNTRERTLSVILLAFIVVAGSGFVGYQFLLAPLRNKEKQIAALQDEIDTKNDRMALIQKRKSGSG